MGTLIGSAELDLGAAFDKQLVTFQPKVDGLVPRTLDVHLRIVRESPAGTRARRQLAGTEHPRLLLQDTGMGTLIGSAELDLGAAFDKQLATSADSGFDQCVTPPQERRGNNFQGAKREQLKRTRAKREQLKRTFTWKPRPWQSYMCHVRSTADGGQQARAHPPLRLAQLGRFYKKASPPRTIQ